MKDQTNKGDKMANAIVTFNIMPESPEVEFAPIVEKALQIAKEFGAKGELRTREEPLAFGLKSIKVMAMYLVTDDLDTDSIAEKMQELEGVQSAEVEKFDLAMG